MIKYIDENLYVQIEKVSLVLDSKTVSLMQDQGRSHPMFQHVDVLLKDQNQVSIEGRTSEIDRAVGYIEYLDQVRQIKNANWELSFETRNGPYHPISEQLLELGLQQKFITDNMHIKQIEHFPEPQLISSLFKPDSFSNGKVSFCKRHSKQTNGTIIWKEGFFRVHDFFTNCKVLN